MTKKYTIVAYKPVDAPITEPITKFGGQPVWLDAPQWPVSRSLGIPMQFICQIALDPELFGELPTRIVYFFITEGHEYFSFTGAMTPDDGESAVIVQPGGTWDGPTLPLVTGPTLFRQRWRPHARHASDPDAWEMTPVEYTLTLEPGDDPPFGTFDDVDPNDPVAWNAYFTALLEEKIGGVPVPTGNNLGDDDCFLGEDLRYRDWRFILQIQAKGDDEADPYYINMSYDGVGYIFLAPDGLSGTFWWTR
jgi:hypothetical protein